MEFIKLHREKFIQTAILLLLAFFLFNIFISDLLGSFSPQLNLSRKLYSQALTLERRDDFTGAYKTFNKIFKGYGAYDAVLFHQAKCSQELGDEKTNINKLSRLLSKYPDSRLASNASYALGQAYMRINDHENAQKYFEMTAKKYPETDYALGSYYYLGYINRSNKDTAFNYWMEYIKREPEGRFTKDCADGILSLGIGLTAQDKKYLGIAYLKHGDYSRAAYFLKSAPFSETWFYLAKHSYQSGNKSQALDFLRQGLSKYPGNFSTDDIHSAMQLYVKLKGQSEKAGWSEVISFAGSKLDYAYYNKALLSAGAEKINLFTAIAEKYPNGDFAPEAIWNLFFDEYKSGNYETALKYAYYHLNSFNNVKSSPQVLFWTGKIYEKTNNLSKAKEFYSLTLRKYPDSYYAFRSDDRLKNINSNENPAFRTCSGVADLEDINSQPEMPYSYGYIKNNFGALTAELLHIGDYDTLSALNINEPFINSWIYFKQGLITKSVITARDEMNKLYPRPSYTDKRWKLIYPLFYAGNIDESCSRTYLENVLVLSIIKEESHFNPLAVSSSNARGLMQVLPTTARFISDKKNLGYIYDIQLFDPAYNIRTGAEYFKYIKSQLNNNDLFAVAAYNAGPGAVQRWMGKYPTSDLDEFIENIPYDQTKNYVKKIYGTYWNYKNTYDIK